MIVFAGCSYTWGSGLQYEYLCEKGWSVDEINEVLPVEQIIKQTMQEFNSVCESLSNSKFEL